VFFDVAALRQKTRQVEQSGRGMRQVGRRQAGQHFARGAGNGFGRRHRCGSCNARRAARQRWRGGPKKRPGLAPSDCHSERSEESSWTLPMASTEPHWILRCAQNDKRKADALGHPRSSVRSAGGLVVRISWLSSPPVAETARPCLCGRAPRLPPAPESPGRDRHRSPARAGDSVCPSTARKS